MRIIARSLVLSSTSWRANIIPLLAVTIFDLLSRRNASAFTITSSSKLGSFRRPLYGLSAQRTSSSSSWDTWRHICSLKTTSTTTTTTTTSIEQGPVAPLLSSLKLGKSTSISRSSFLSLTVATLVTTTTTTLLVEPVNAAEEDGTTVTATTKTTTTTTSEQGPLAGEDNNNSIKVYKLPSGLKYVELQEGTGPTPKYGQLCCIAYKGYIKVAKTKDNPNPQPQLFDQASEYLTKHGNGRLIPGLDEGLHTIKVGGKRRIIIPPKLGYIDIGLGPMPEYPWDRRKLSSLLDEMVMVQGGNIIFEVQLLRAFDDEADQGYYQDGSVSSIEEEKIQQLLQQQRDKGPPA